MRVSPWQNEHHRCRVPFAESKIESLAQIAEVSGGGSASLATGDDDTASAMDSRKSASYGTEVHSDVDPFNMPTLTYELVKTDGSELDRRSQRSLNIQYACPFQVSVLTLLAATTLRTSRVTAGSSSPKFGT